MLLSGVPRKGAFFTDVIVIQNAILSLGKNQPGKFVRNVTKAIWLSILPKKAQARYARIKIVILK